MHFSTQGLPNYTFDNFVVCKEIISTYQQELNTANFLLVTRRYNLDAPMPYRLTIIRDEDELGWDRTVQVGLCTAEVIRWFSLIARFNGLKAFPWYRLPEDLKFYLEAYQMPAEWHGQMSHPAFSTRVSIYSRDEPTKPFQAYPDELAEFRVRKGR